MSIEEIENILLVISDKDYDEDSAIASFTDLYRGYSKSLNSVVSRALKDRGVYDEEMEAAHMESFYGKDGPSAHPLFHK